jgi:hypothetical protein
MKEIQVTLYEVLGYLIPGMVALAGLLLVASSLLDGRAVVLAGIDSAWVRVGLLFIAYLLGHAVQGVANLVFRWLNTRDLTRIPEDFRTGLIAALREKRRIAASHESLFEICDALIVSADGPTELRDIYVYREGFYRGTTVAIAVAIAGTFVAWCSWPWSVQRPSNATFIAALAFMAAVDVLFFKRFMRFAEYRTRSVIFGAAAIVSDSK